MSKTNLTRDQQLLLNKLTAIHGPVRIAYESEGLHFYIPSPTALKRDGKVELYKKHLSVNVDKYLRGQPWSGLCHKYSVSYSVDDLLTMAPIESRLENIGHVSRRITHMPDNTQWLERDESGNMVPLNPGTTVKLTDLPEDHPVCLYLLNRKGGPFPLDLMEEYFGCCYCSEANPKLPSKLVGGVFRKNSEGRLIFKMRQLGVNAGWQARYLDHEQSGIVYIWSQSAQNWQPVYKIGEDGSKELLPPFSGDRFFDLPKYIISPGAQKASCLLGLEGALRRFGGDGVYLDTLYLVEGPLDAARVAQAGFPAVAVMGKYLSANQAALISNICGRVVVIRDNDRAGEDFLSSAVSRLSEKNMVPDSIVLPSEYKDAGETPVETLNKIINEKLRKDG